MESLKSQLAVMAENWPSKFITRRQVEQFTGGIIKPGYLANLDSQGKGPIRFRIGGKTVYSVKDFMDWLESRSMTL